MRLWESDLICKRIIYTAGCIEHVAISDYRDLDRMYLDNAPLATSQSLKYYTCHTILVGVDVSSIASSKPML